MLPNSRKDRGAPVYEGKGLCSTEGISPFDFNIKKGEINGFTGLLGSGRSECVRTIFGADKVTGGTVKMEGTEVRINKPIDAMKHGIAYLPEDRKRDGIIGDLSVKDNIKLALQVKTGFFKPFSKAKATKFANEYIKAARHQDRFGQYADQVPLGRKSAEGHTCKVAADAS